MKKIGIIGNGVSAVTAIREIRRADQDVNIDVFSDEGYGYYPRPKLIELIANRESLTEIVRYDHNWYEKNNSTLRLSEPVVGINPSSRSIMSKAATHFDYDRILITTGCHPFVPPIHGVEKAGVHVLRTLDDALAIKEHVSSSSRQIIIGGGILGIELASAIKAVGGSPLVISNIAQLLPAQLDQGASSALLSRLENMGLNVLLGFTCVQVTGPDMSTGVVSTTGDKIRGDCVIMATGVKPNTKMAQESGIAVGRGITVDDQMLTSERGIYAAGDCVEWKGFIWGIIPVALDTSKIAAKNLIDHGSATYTGTTPSNTLQVAGIDLTSIGNFNPKSPDYQSVVRTDESDGTYFKAVLKDKVVVGGIALGDRKVAMKLRRLVNSSEIVENTDEIFDA